MLNGVYSLTDLEDLWKQAGGNPASAKTAAAIALAESNGDPKAHNPSGATGLWQILGNPGPGSAWDPLTNAKFAVAKSNNGTNWNPWVTYTNGRYKQFLNFSQYQPLPSGAAGKPFSQIDPNADAGGVGGGVGGLSGVGGIGDTASAITGAIGGAFNQAVSDLKYGVVLLAALAVAVVLLTHGVRGSGGEGRKVVPIPV